MKVIVVAIIVGMAACKQHAQQSRTNFSESREKCEIHLQSDDCDPRAPDLPKIGNEILDIRFFDEKIDLPEQSLSERVERINGLIKQHGAKGVVVKIVSGVHHQTMVDAVVLNEPTLRELIKFTCSNRMIFARVKDNVVEIYGPESTD